MPRVHPSCFVLYSCCAVFVLAAVLILGATRASAFCVYNNTNETIHVDQTIGGKTFGSMSGFIQPGKRQCCNWENDDCNTKGQRTSKVGFTVKYYRRGMGSPTLCADKIIKAGGWLTVTGNYPDGQCEGHF